MLGVVVYLCVVCAYVRTAVQCMWRLEEDTMCLLLLLSVLVFKAESLTEPEAPTDSGTEDPLTLAPVI